MHVRTEEEIGLLIRERRKGMGLDQAGLAAQVGVSRQWVVEVEKGKTRAEIGLVLRTFRVLGITLNATVPGAAKTADQTPPGSIEIDDVIDRARGERSGE